jgi:hypothetical protein
MHAEFSAQICGSYLNPPLLGMTLNKNVLKNIGGEITDGILLNGRDNLSPMIVKLFLEIENVVGAACPIWFMMLLSIIPIIPTFGTYNSQTIG